MALEQEASGRLLRFHAAMLADRRRLDTYRRAVAQTVRPGDVVVDIGAGVGMLGFWALEAGARHVYAVERDRSLVLARKAAEATGLADRVTFIEGYSTEIELPERADVMVADILETWGLNARILSTTLDARERLLKPGARMLPRAMEPFVAPVSFPAGYERFVDIYRAAWTGIDYGALAHHAASVLHPLRPQDADLLAEGASLGRVDLAAHTDATFTGTVTVEVSRTATAHGLAGWFRAELTDDDEISTTPDIGTVGYAMAYAPFETPLELVSGTPVAIAVDTYDGAQWRWSAETADGQRREQATLDAFPLDAAALRPRG